MNDSNDLKVPLVELIDCLADTVDLVSPALADHHNRVGYLANALGRQLALPEEVCQDLLLAGKVHDIGALSLAERMKLMEFEVEETAQHSETGALLLEIFPPLAPIANLVRFHHLHWGEARTAADRGMAVPFGSHIIHLADRVGVLIDTSLDDASLLGKAPELHASVAAHSGTLFAPEVVEAFSALAARESFWLQLKHPLFRPRQQRSEVTLDTVEITAISRLFAHIIDFRSHFTATHSSGVAAAVEALGRLAGRPEDECRQLKIAGLLHDLGKLAVANELLEKPAALTEREREVIRCHPFYTRRALERITCFHSIAAWSSDHHERLDASGYPNHTGERDLPLPSRMVAVADVFTAITEDRPYRIGMDRAEARHTMQDMVSRRALDGEVTALLMANYEEVDAIRVAAQSEAAQEYGAICRKVQVLSGGMLGSLRQSA